MSARFPAMATGTSGQTLPRLNTQLEFKCGNGRMKHLEQWMFTQDPWHVRPGSDRTSGGLRHPLPAGGIRHHRETPAVLATGKVLGEDKT